MSSGPAISEEDAEGQKDILCKAAQCFAERGYSAATIDYIARQLGCTIGRIYHFYPTKMDLFLALHWKALESCEIAVKPVYQSGLPAFERLCKMSLAHCIAIINTLPFHKVVKEGLEMHFRCGACKEHLQELEEVIASRKRYSMQYRELLRQSAEEGLVSYENDGVAIQLLFMSLNSPAYWNKDKVLQNNNEIQERAIEITRYALSGLGADKNKIPI